MSSSIIQQPEWSIPELKHLVRLGTKREKSNPQPTWGEIATQVSAKFGQTRSSAAAKQKYMQYKKEGDKIFEIDFWEIKAGKKTLGEHLKDIYESAASQAEVYDKFQDLLNKHGINREMKIEAIKSKVMRLKRSSKISKNILDRVEHSPEVAARVRALYQNGVPDEEAAMIMGLSVHSYKHHLELVRDVATKTGAPIRRGEKQTLSVEDLDKELEDIHALTFYDIFKKTNIDPVEAFTPSKNHDSGKVTQAAREYVAPIEGLQLGKIIGGGDGGLSYTYEDIQTRFDNYVAGLESILSHHIDPREAKKKRIHIAFMGDMVHAPKVVNLQNMYVVGKYAEEFMAVMTQFARLIAGLGEKFGEVRVYGICSTKSLVRGYEQIKENNFDYVFYKYIEHMCQAYRNIKWDIESPNAQIIKASGVNILMKPDAVSNDGKMGASLTSAINSKYTDLAYQLRMGKEVDIGLYMLGGSGNALVYDNIITNDNWLGTNNINARRTKLDARPVQLIFAVENKENIPWVAWERRIELIKPNHKLSR